MPILSSVARRLKHRFFLDAVLRDDVVLEIGSGDGWVSRYLNGRGVTQVMSIDVFPPATIVGDIREWKSLGLKAESFDVIVAFEVIEHVDCLNECYSLLRPGGRILATTPNPPADWILERFERWKLNQPRTSAHDRLTYLKETDQFSIEKRWHPLNLSQWCVLVRKHRNGMN